MALRARVTGSSLLDQLENTIEQISELANDRASVVSERLAELESEQAALRQLQRKARAVQAA